jgi:hypothetical protein
MPAVITQATTTRFVHPANLSTHTLVYWAGKGNLAGTYNVIHHWPDGEQPTRFRFRSLAEARVCWGKIRDHLVCQGFEREDVAPF